MVIFVSTKYSKTPSLTLLRFLAYSLYQNDKREGTLRLALIEGTHLNKLCQVTATSQRALQLSMGNLS